MVSVYSVVSHWTTYFIKPTFQICVCVCGVFSLVKVARELKTTHVKPFKHSIIKEISPENIHWKG